MAEHTLGPWEWSLQGTRPEIGQYHSHRITQKHSPKKPSLIASIQNHPLLARAEEEANARLITAAPDMLATLEWIADGSWNDGPGSWAVLDRRVEETIAKARGEADGG